MKRARGIAVRVRSARQIWEMQVRVIVRLVSLRAQIEMLRGLRRAGFRRAAAPLAAFDCHYERTSRVIFNARVATRRFDFKIPNDRTKNSCIEH